MCKRIFAHQTSEKGDIPFYKIGTIGNVPDAFISIELFDEYKNKYKYPRKGEVLITCAGTVGKCLVFDGIDSYFQDSNIVWISNPKHLIENSFLYYFVSNVDWSKLNATTITRLYNDDLRNLKIKFPDNIQEQKKIANLLSLIDQRLQTQNKIIEDLKLQKEALVEHLFRQEYPTRFSGFSDKWNLFTYNELFDVSTTKNTDNSIDNVLSASQIYGMIDRNEIDIDIKFDEKSIKSYKIVEPGDYVIHLRSFQGGFAFSDKKGICSPAYTILKPKELLEYGFLKEYFMSGRFIKSLKLVTYGIRDGRSISVSEFMKLKIYLPSKSEQIKIMEALSAINEKINLNGKLGDLLQKQKRYLLKNMFV